MMRKYLSTHYVLSTLNIAFNSHYKLFTSSGSFPHQHYGFDLGLLIRMLELVEC